MSNTEPASQQWNQRSNAPPPALGDNEDVTYERHLDQEAILRINEKLEQRVAERTAELVRINEQLQLEVAERTRAEALLRESEARARTLVEHAPEAIVVFDGESGRFLECNPNAERLYGLSREQLIGRHPAELSPLLQPDGRSSTESAREKIRQAVEGQTPVFEWTHVHSSGRSVPCEVRLVRLPAQDRTLIRGSVIDNTERQRHEKVQQATYAISEAVHSVADLDALYERMHRIVKSLMPAENFYIALVDPVTRMISFPYHVDELTPRPLPFELGTGLTGYVYRFGRPLLVNDEMNRRKRYVEEEVTFEGFADIRYEESGVPAAIWLGVPLAACGKAFGVMAVQDYHNPNAYGEAEKQLLGFVAEQVALAIERRRVLDSLRESEARFSTAFHASPLFLTILRVNDTRFVEVNEAVLRWSGYTREEFLGRSSAELKLWVNPADRERFWAELRKSRSVRDRECLLKNRSGAVHTISISADIIEIDNVEHLLMVSQDITQRKLAEEELLKALAREKELGQLRSNFVSMVSHEFRTPLGVIQSSAEILEDYFDELTPEERREHLTSIHKNTRRMAGLMEEVLLLGRFDAGKMNFTPKRMDIVGFSRRVVEEVSRAMERRCPVECSFPLLPEVQADERLLRHIFTNLLTNAIKYSQPGQKVSLQLSQEQGDLVLIVKDCGVGIPSADLEWVFQAFHRGRNVGDRPGTGLGMVIVKRCVELHSGSIAIQSEVGHGTTVTVRLPVFASGPS